MRFSQDGTHLVDQIIANPENVFTWSTKPDASEYTGSAWFSDIGAMGYSDGNNWSTPTYNSLIRSKGVVLSEFTNGVTDLTGHTANSGTLSIDTSPDYAGRGVLVTTTDVAKSTYMDFICTPFKLESDTLIVLLWDVTQRESVSSTIQVTTQASNFAGYCSATGMNISATSVSADGGKCITYITGAELDAGKTGDLSITIGDFIDKFRLRLTTNPGVKATLLGAYLNPACKPTTFFTFDDSFLSSFTHGVQYLAKKGIVGTLAINSTNIGADNRYSLAVLQQAYDAGWDLVNHTHTHVNAILKGTSNQIALAQTVAAAGFMTLNGSTGATIFDAPRQLTITSANSLLAKRFVVTGLGEAGEAQTETNPGAEAGSRVFGTKVWTRVDTIQSLDTTTGNITIGYTYSYDEMYYEINTCKQFLLANGFTRAHDLYVSPNGAETTLSIRALRDLGYKYHRGTKKVLAFPQICPHPFNIESFGNNIAIGDSATLIAWIDLLIARVATGGIHLHDIVEDTDTPNATQSRVGDFRLVVDYLATKIKAGEIECPKMYDYVKRTQA